MVFETSDIVNAECFDFRVGPDFALFKTEVAILADISGCASN
jgi:hypothetical protein